MSTERPEMSADEAIEIVKIFDRHSIDIWVDGGWGVDALLGKQTRTHQDLDIAIEHRHVPKLRNLLTARGYRDFSRNDTRDYNFVLADDRGHQLDVHSYTFDAAGNHTYGIPYPYESLTGTGIISNYPVKCISADWAVKFHTGYLVDDDDYHDVRAICQHFGLEIPEDYAEFMKTDLQLSN